MKKEDEFEDLLESNEEFQVVHEKPIVVPFPAAVAENAVRIPERSLKIWMVIVYGGFPSVNSVRKALGFSESDFKKELDLLYELNLLEFDEKLNATLINMNMDYKLNLK